MSNFGTCDDCGYTAPDFESARVHARDKHGGITPRMLDRFRDEDDENFEA